jgi:hypothetical protein
MLLFFSYTARADMLQYTPHDVFNLFFFLHRACGHASTYTWGAAARARKAQAILFYFEKYVLWGLYSEEVLVLTFKTKAFLFLRASLSRGIGTEFREFLPAKGRKVI